MGHGASGGVLAADDRPRPKAVLLSSLDIPCHERGDTGSKQRRPSEIATSTDQQDTDSGHRVDHLFTLGKAEYEREDFSTRLCLRIIALSKPGQHRQGVQSPPLSLLCFSVNSGIDGFVPACSRRSLHPGTNTGETNWTYLNFEWRNEEDLACLSSSGTGAEEDSLPRTRPPECGTVPKGTQWGSSLN